MLGGYVLHDRALETRNETPYPSRARKHYIRSSILRGTSVQAGESDLELISLFIDYDDWAVRFFGLHPRAAASSGRHSDGDGLVGSPLQIASMDAGECRIVLSEGRSTLAPLQEECRGGRIPAAKTAELTRRCNLKPFWNGTRVWGDHDTPQADGSRTGSGTETNGETGEPPALIEDRTLTSLIVTSPEGRLGAITDLVVDIEHWKARYLIVRVFSDEEEERLLSPFWISIGPDSPHIRVPMTKATVLNAPCFDPDDLTPFDESVLARYYGFLVES